MINSTSEAKGQLNSDLPNESHAMNFLPKQFVKILDSHSTGKKRNINQWYVQKDVLSLKKER